ncbi:hypothetical protein [Pseudoxanthomonas winnipegensis]|uniref:Uncharacterized protein n=1 Tax=Pseudoxanthomonas winnipegensis TaxID=2480810 RepID=A0A4Q8L9W9_9GAMM|nr:hypothetical protein [Pseudoxanthomonas winnipegensis]RZZ81427.1 hypothetical protein EA663_20610 [Pseudoxanthomonas winnipegensis]TAA25422.1 hypothetical protein EA660_08150 [Pseudoxanthomonas winnipegensis]
MNRAILAGLAALCLCGCSKWQEHSFQGKAEDYLRDHLKDPSSAQFKNTRVLWRQDKELILCGQLNAKNGMGGYTGFVPFFVVGKIEGLGTRDYAATVPSASVVTDEEKAEALAFFKAYEGNCGRLPEF